MRSEIPHRWLIFMLSLIALTLVLLVSYSPASSAHMLSSQLADRYLKSFRARSSPTVTRPRGDS